MSKLKCLRHRLKIEGKRERGEDRTALHVLQSLYLFLE